MYDIPLSQKYPRCKQYLYVYHLPEEGLKKVCDILRNYRQYKHITQIHKFYLVTNEEQLCKK